MNLQERLLLDCADTWLTVPEAAELQEGANRKSVQKLLALAVQEGKADRRLRGELFEYRARPEIVDGIRQKLSSTIGADRRRR